MPWIVWVAFISAYAFWPTVRTIEYQQNIGLLPQDVSQYDVFLSVPNCGTIGWEAVMIAEGVTYDGIIFDCGGSDGGHDWMVQYMDGNLNHAIVEVDYHFRQQHPELIGTGIKAIIQVGNHWSDE